MGDWVHGGRLAESFDFVEEHEDEVFDLLEGRSCIWDIVEALHEEIGGLIVEPLFCQP